MKKANLNRIRELKEKLSIALKKIDEMKERMEESEKKYKDLYENAPDMYHTIDKKGIIIDCNNTELMTLGYSKDELIGRSILDIQTEDSREKGKKAMSELFSSGKIEGLELQFVKKSGELIDVGINATVIYDRNGRAFGTRSVIRDITKEKKMMSVIRDSQFKLKAIFDAITDGICLINKDFTIENINKSMALYFSGSPVEFVSKKCYDAFENKGSMCEGCKVMKTFNTGETVSYTHIKKLKDGKFVELDVSTFPITDEKGKVAQIVYYMRDVTERRRLEREVEYSQRLAELGEIITGVAHEVRTPLQNIFTGLDLLEGEARKKELDLDIVNNLRRFIGDMDFIVQELLDFTKPIRLKLEECDITNIVDDIILSRNQQMKKWKIKVFKKYDKLVKKSFMDIKKVKHIFNNIIENSIHAMPDGGEFTASVNSYNDYRGKFIKIQFSDTGCGISRRNIDKIFNPLFSTKSKGIGMGLAIAKRFIEQHSGEIIADSEEGKGCSITVLLPLKESES